MDFEWDEVKSAKNLRERGFDFAFAALIFDNPTIERIDARKDYGEVRVQAIGEVDGFVLFVTYTDRDGRRRIISARMAKSQERARWQRFVNP
jgi:uncharacterized protein